MPPAACWSRAVQRMWMRLGEFLLDHRQLWLIAVLFIVAAQPLAYRLFRLVIRYLL